MSHLKLSALNGAQESTGGPLQSRLKENRPAAAYSGFFSCYRLFTKRKNGDEQHAECQHEHQ